MSYGPTSPYFNTKIHNNQFLDVMENRTIPGDPADTYWAITPGYNMRPDLLAYDLYQDSKLWWVFAVRNPNTLADPLFDFTTGTYIYIPSLNVLKQALRF
jgi:hypothetical protein